MLMAAEERWYFTKEEINNSPSRRCGIDAEKELSYRQQGANLIQDMGQRLQVNQLAINTAIVYMHRFYMYHPFTRFHRNSIAPAALFLAAKVEEQPRKLEHVIKVAYHCLFRDHPPLDTQSEAYLERAQELVVNENILLQTLGFDVAIDHPHTHVVKCCQLVRATKDLAQTSYFMATSSLHMTTMCLQYKPTVVACVCIYIVCTWSHYEIQRATEGKDWFWYVDKSVTLELLETLTAEFLAILDKCPNRLKKIMNSSQHTDDRSKSSQGSSSSSSLSSSRAVTGGSSSSVSSSRSHDHNSHNKSGVKVPQSQPHQHPQPPKLNLKEYNEKREKERREREKMRDRDVVDPREGRQFTLVSTSHSSQSAPPSTVATIASSHSLHTVLPSSRSKSSKGSSGRSSHPEHAKASAVHGTNHKTHGHGTNQGPRGEAQPPLEALRVGTADARQDQRRDISARSDSDRFDKSNRTSSSVVDGRLLGHETKPSVSDIRQHHVVDIKHSRQSLDASVLERKSEIKHEQRMAERKPPEPKLEQVKVKTEIKSDIKTEIKEEKTSDTKSEAKEYNTIFHNSDMSDFTLNDFLSDNNFLNLNDGPPDELFDNSDSETKPDVSAILEDKNLLPQPAHQKSKSPGACQQQQQQPVQQAQHQQHHTSSINTAGVVSNASSNGEQRVSDSAATAPNYHNPRYHSATNGSVPPPQPAQTTPQHTSKSSSSSKRSRESERRNSERGEAELVPMVTKLEDTKYRTALSDPATPIKVRAEAQNLAMANATSKPAAATHSAPAPAVPEPVQKNPSEHVLRMKLPRPDHLKESQPDPATVLMVGAVAGTEHKKHKHDHPHHKHKEKKKHKHKDKDKHKDREHKEHKEHKKEKKHKKHKDKDKERDRSRGGEDGASAPIKITITKDKVLYTPEAGSVPLRTHSTTATPVAPPINTTSANTTPSIPKFKIQKSRLKQKDLFGGTSSTSPESSPAGDLARDTPTTSLKIKISRDRLRPDKESKKRDRDRSPGDIQASKVPRNGSEARSTHASPQVGAGHSRHQDVRGNAHHRQYSQQQQQAQQQPPPPMPPHAKMPMHLQGSQAQYPRAPPPPSAGVVPMIQPGPYAYQQFYPQYSIPPPNFSYPPPPYHPPPPPGPHAPPMPYMQAPPPAYMTGHPPLPHSTASSNPPLPAEPPPPTPPPPPPE
ncbi:cyclin-T2-like isoform X2 [Penaeus japonicus]|uniref:cyclin-T2-like isoform X2 n=1 Tax=Penaeus japonicus TaxID=27405 RepID=UPI001C7159DD|nr:cyclin-T2-like isoform X2 [Penaeus japonicus]